MIILKASVLLKYRNRDSLKSKTTSSKKSSNKEDQNDAEKNKTSSNNECEEEEYTKSKQNVSSPKRNYDK